MNLTATLADNAYLEVKTAETRKATWMTRMVTRTIRASEGVGMDSLWKFYAICSVLYYHYWPQFRNESLPWEGMRPPAFFHKPLIRIMKYNILLTIHFQMICGHLAGEDQGPEILILYSISHFTTHSKIPGGRKQVGVVLRRVGTRNHVRIWALPLQREESRGWRTPMCIYLIISLVWQLTHLPW